jgi:hypothetical protein
MNSTSAVFLLNLVQDVTILRPLIFMAARDFSMETLLLVSDKFLNRDLFGIWQTEIDQICAETGAANLVYEDEFSAHQALDGRSGLLFAASETTLSAHNSTHDVFRYAPSGLLKITLQHGFECMGFMHSADHDRAHGKSVSFGADIVCPWYDTEMLAATAQSQRSKLHVTGSSSVLQQPQGPVIRDEKGRGIVCENLHSVRLNIAGDFRTQFVDAFAEFCTLLDKERQEVFLRPHPGGQYVLKKKFRLPFNAIIKNAPIYKVDLRGFGYGISAPSSVLIDMLMADIPTAVWRDSEGVMDSTNYDGLTEVHTPSEWFEFARDAANNPEPFIALQRRFLEAQRMPLDPSDVYRRFADIMLVGKRMATISTGRKGPRERILFVANALVPTLQLSFIKPLVANVEAGEITTELLTEIQIREKISAGLAGEEFDDWLENYLNLANPSVIIFCRYSGPCHEKICLWAQEMGVPIIYHIDDDLLQIPPDIGARKHAFHNNPERIATVEALLTHSDLVYASTERLKQRFRTKFPESSIRAGRIYCSSDILREAELKPVTKVGYMASADHAHNLEMILPAIVDFLARNPDVNFELFGSIPVPEQLLQFGHRITTAPPIGNYDQFLTEFSRYGWDIGICPLTPIDFNLAKANTKWVEYTAVGAAVVASRDTVYDACCADGCGILAQTEPEWLAALELLVRSPEERFAQVRRAQDKLRREYGIDQLRQQVFDMIDTAKQALKS